MAQITKDLIIDVAKKNLCQAIVAKQNDINSRFLRVTLCNEGDKIEVPSNATVLINAERADGESNAFSGTVGEDGTVTVPLANWMLELDGIVRCSVSIIGLDEEKLTSTSFLIEVESAETLTSDISEDQNYDILVKLISDTLNVKSACETATNLANTAATNAKAATISANNAASTANSAAEVAWEAASADGVVIKDTTNSVDYFAKFRLVGGKLAIEYTEL